LSGSRWVSPTSRTSSILYSTKELRVFIFPLDGVLVHYRVTNLWVQMYLYTWGTVRVKWTNMNSTENQKYPGKTRERGDYIQEHNARKLTKLEPHQLIIWAWQGKWLVSQLTLLPLCWHQHLLESPRSDENSLPRIVQDKLKQTLWEDKVCKNMSHTKMKEVISTVGAHFCLWIALVTWPIGTITQQWKQDTNSKYFTMMLWLRGNTAQPENKTKLIAFLLLAEENT